MYPLYHDLSREGNISGLLFSPLEQELKSLKVWQHTRASERATMETARTSMRAKTTVLRVTSIWGPNAGSLIPNSDLLISNRISASL